MKIAIKTLVALPYVDATRIGFWGWSGGGYMSIMLLTRCPQLYSCGVAVAPVTDLRLYDTIWTERYMGLLDENLSGYEVSGI